MRASRKTKINMYKVVHRPIGWMPRKAGTTVLAVRDPEYVLCWAQG